MARVICAAKATIGGETVGEPGRQCWRGRGPSLARPAPSQNLLLQILAQSPTLDVTLEIAGELPKDVLAKANEYGVADLIVKPHIPTAFHAARDFVDAYRDVKYSLNRGTESWRRKEVFVPRMTELEFNTFLFYQLSIEPNVTSLGAFSQGEFFIVKPFDPDVATRLQSGLNTKIPRHTRFIQIAWERLFDEDFAGAVIQAAIAVESGMTRILREELSQRSVGTASQIGKVLDDTSNRLLCTVVLGVLGIGDADLRQALCQLFELRNGLAHGSKVRTDQKEARLAVETAESFLNLLRPDEPEYGSSPLLSKINPKF